MNSEVVFKLLNYIRSGSPAPNSAYTLCFQNGGEWEGEGEGCGLETSHASSVHRQNIK
jgi:hypothetical protein